MKEPGQEDENFREVQRRKKTRNNKIQPKKQKENITIESQNKFKVLQEEEIETRGERR